MARILTKSMAAKILEQLDLTQCLIGRLPPDCLDASPLAGSWSVGLLLGHLLECAAGVCAVLAAALSEQTPLFVDLRGLPVNQRTTPEDAVARLLLYRERIEAGFRHLTDDDLARPLPTVFVPAGETVLTLLIGNLEHLINHKYQLFTCLKQLGQPVGTPDLYRFRA